MSALFTQGAVMWRWITQSDQTPLVPTPKIYLESIQLVECNLSIPYILQSPDNSAVSDIRQRGLALMSSMQ
jgi:hypothetical protein